MRSAKSKTNDIVRKPVAFNAADPFQQEMLNHAKQFPNFSGYIKRLIQRDMEGGNVTPMKKRSNNAVQRPVVNLDAELARGVI